MSNVGARKRGRRGERGGRLDLCSLWSMLRCQLCASHTKCCLRTLAHRWLVTSVAHTSGGSSPKKEKKTPMDDE